MVGQQPIHLVAQVDRRTNHFHCLRRNRCEHFDSDALRAFRTMFHEAKFTREELFAKVWGMPLLRLAKEIGVTDVALGKACRRAFIPLPGRGYWAMPEHRRPNRPVLPSPPQGHPGVIRFLVMDDVQRVQSASPAMEDVAPIPVPGELASPHPLVARTKKALKGLKPIEGRLQAPKSAGLDIGISPEQVNRVLRLLDALIKACEQRGWRWKLSEEGTLVHCKGEQVRIRVWEVLSRRAIPMEQRSVNWRLGPRKIADDAYYQRFEWISSGRVNILIENAVANGARQSWQSTPTSPVEDRLHDVVANLPLVAEGMRLRREEQEAWKRNAEEQAARRIEAARADEVQRRLRARLVKSLENWERSVRLHRFCDAASERAKQLDGDERERAEAWVAWARDQARALDSLGMQFDDTTDLHIELERWFSGNHQSAPEDWWSATLA